MKTLTKLLLFFVVLFYSTSAYAQQPDIDFFRANDKTGINIFETKKAPAKDFNGLTVRVGGDFALQLQGLSQENTAGSLGELSSNFTLPTANLNLDIQLEKGVRLHMRTYLSSKHHNEAWVKGGFMQIDDLDFISEGFLSNIMQYTTIRAGMNDINYGDTHFRRSDNANAIYNPFVGNYLMDSFTTEPFMEFTVQYTDYLAVIGFTNGRLNQSPTPGDDGFAFYGKLGYDSQINEDLRARLTASIYTSTDAGTRDYLYGGDRAGSRYYSILTGGDFDGRFNPGFPFHTAFQLNPFVKWKGVEFFGVFENTSNGSDAGGAFTQIGAELLYRFGLFGKTENFYVGGRYNSITGNQFNDLTSDPTVTLPSNVEYTFDVDRLNLGFGWFMTDNVLTKIEYVSQNYSGNGNTSDYNFFTRSGLANNGAFDGAKFNGFMIEAVISF